MRGEKKHIFWIPAVNKISSLLVRCLAQQKNMKSKNAHRHTEEKKVKRQQQEEKERKGEK